jgi:hypothetical protein
MEVIKTSKRAWFAFAITSLLCSLPSNFAQAQQTSGVKARHHLTSKDDDQPTETALAIDEGAFLGYGGVRWGSSYMDGQWIPTVGVRGMWLYQEKMAFGLDFTALSGRYHPYKDAARRGWTQSVTTWGAVLQMTTDPRQEFHYQYGLTFGRGITRLSADDLELPDRYEAPKTFFMIAPEGVVRWNLTKYTRPFVGVSAMIPFASSGNQELKEAGLSRIYTFIGVDIGAFTL